MEGRIESAGRRGDAISVIGSFPENEGNFRRLSDDYDSSLGVVPFIGAGVTIPLGFPGWRSFLLAQAKRVGLENDISELLGVGKYEEAAEVLFSAFDDQAFSDAIEDSFGDHIMNRAPLRGPILLIPRLATGPVITTNFDHTLERAFEESHQPFERVVWGAKGDIVAKTFTQNRRLLLKLHGDVDDRTERILTMREYGRYYSKSRPLFRLLKKIFSTRPVLFIGCSLSNDRVVNVLTAITRDSALASHYAIVEAPENDNHFRERARFLSEHRIRPLWYPYGRHDLIETLLVELLQQRSPDPAPKLALRKDSDASDSDTIPFEAEKVSPSPTVRHFVRGERREMPTERRALGHNSTVGGHDVRVYISFYEEGSPAELIIATEKLGSTVSGMLDCFSTAVSIGLQHGVPIETLIDIFSDAPCYVTSSASEHAETVVSNAFEWIRSRFIGDEVPQQSPRPESSFWQRLPVECASVSHEFSIAGHSGTITVLISPDGRPAALRVQLHKGNATVAGLIDCWADAISIALQHGVPLKLICEAFAHVRFDPSGWTGSEDIGYAKSFPDYISRWMQLRFVSVMGPDGLWPLVKDDTAPLHLAEKLNDLEAYP